MSDPHDLIAGLRKIADDAHFASVLLATERRFSEAEKMMVIFEKLRAQANELEDIIDPPRLTPLAEGETEDTTDAR